MDIPWQDVPLFLAVAETGSVSAAARRLRLSQATASRRLAELEDAVGGRLFRRSVTGAALTAAGERLLEPARRMAEWGAELARAAERSAGGPTGLVRLAATPLVAFEFVAPFAAWLSREEPGLRLEVLADHRYVDLARREADLALRLRAPKEADLVVLHTLELEQAVHVAPALAERLPRRPKLSEIPWITWSPPFEDLGPNPQLREVAPDHVPAFVSDSILVHLAAAEAGVGAIVLPRLRHRFARRSGLVPLDVDLGRWARGALHLVAARSALAIPRVERLAALLAAELAKVQRR
ncbi:MAG: LysR family transcriptional regulator [Anaeromyxobacteraceae bacterium]